MILPYSGDTYSGWNFSTIWGDDVTSINSGYPVLKLTTGIEYQTTNIVDNCELLQNYPNPFNSTTTIPYILKVKSEVILNIYNSKGEIVKEISLDKQSQGIYDYKLDVNNFSAGIYYYSLILDGKVNKSKKMLYLK